MFSHLGTLALPHIVIADALKILLRRDPLKTPKPVFKQKESEV